MKILFVGNIVYSIYNQRKELLEELIKLNYTVKVMSGNENEDKKIEEIKKMLIEHIEIKIERRGKNIFSEINTFFQYLKNIKRISPEIVLLYNLKPILYCGVICQLLGINYVSTITGLGTMFQKKKYRKIVSWIYKISLRKSQVVFFQNKDNYNLFIKNKIIKGNQAKLINGSGVNLERYKPENKKINEKTIFLFIGRIMKEKGIIEYLACAKKIKERLKNVEFQILGSLEEIKYAQIIKELEEKGIVKYLGISNDVREQIRNVDCIINPSWHEGMSNVLLEGGAMKKFLIASNISGCNEIVKNNITGLTFKVKDENELEKKIIEYLEMDHNKKNNIIKNLYSHINKNFNRNKIIKQYIEIIQKIIQM